MHGSDEKVNCIGVGKHEQERDHIRDQSDGRSVKIDVQFGLKVYTKGYTHSKLNCAV